MGLGNKVCMYVYVKYCPPSYLYEFDFVLYLHHRTLKYKMEGTIEIFIMRKCIYVYIYVSCVFFKHF